MVSDLEISCEFGSDRVLIVLALCCDTGSKRRGERGGRSASKGRIARDTGGNIVEMEVNDSTRYEGITSNPA